MGIDVFFNDNFINLMSVMKSAVAKFGRPLVWNFDNGSAYKNKQMELLAARIGSALNYCKPYTPTQKAKIERWFRTMKDQWLASLDIRDFRTLDELRGNLHAYVQRYNQSVHTSLNGKSPQDRFFSEPELIHRLSQEELDSAFLLEIERRVSADSVITISQVEYEVDYRFAKQRIRLLNKHENAVIKREKIRLSIHEPLRQRIVMNYNLEALSKEEGRNYIFEKLKGAGCNQTVFEESAMEAVLNAADGIPRIMNKLCNACLLIGNSEGANLITPDIVMQAVSDCELQSGMAHGNYYLPKPIFLNCVLKAGDQPSMWSWEVVAWAIICSSQKSMWDARLPIGRMLSGTGHNFHYS